MTDLERQAFRPDRTFEIGAVKYGARILGNDAVGSTSFVYLAYRLLPDGAAGGERLILKRFLASSHRLFEIERDILQEVASLDHGELGQHFPRVIAAHQAVFEGQSSYLLLMEHAGDQPVSDRLPLNEAEALALMRHYLECLRKLFEAGFTCWDRKTKDFYWRSPATAPPDGELRVIDWNMAQPYQLTNAHNDLVKAGQLSYELLTGHPLLRRKGSTIYQFDPAWRRISFGTQQIVRTMLTGVPDLVGRVASEQDQRQLLGSRLKNLRQQCRAVEALHKTILSQELMNDADKLLKKGQPLEALRRTSIVALKGSTAADGWEGNVEWNTAEWKQIHDSSYAETMRTLDVLGPSRQKMEDVQASVMQIARDLQQLLRDNTQLSPEQELSAARWWLLASALVEAGTDADGLRVQAARALETHEKSLAQGMCGDAQRCWDSLLSSQPLHPHLEETLRVIRAEAEIRNLEIRAADAGKKGDYSQALNELQEITNMLGKLRGSKSR